MSAVLRNEEAAVRQREFERNNDHLTKSTLSVHLALTRLDNLLSANVEELPRSRFAKIIRQGFIDSVIIVDSHGVPLYPKFEEVSKPNRMPDGELWQQARRMEFEERNYSEAAKAYSRIAESVANLPFQIRARMSQAACLQKFSDKGEAIRILESASGRLVSILELSEELQLLTLKLKLRLLELLDNPASPRFKTYLETLKNSLANYDDINIPSADRIFLSEELSRHSTNYTQSVTLVGEVLALRFLETGPDLRSPGIWVRSELPNIWHRLIPNSRCITLATTRHIREIINEAATPLLPSELQVISAAPDETLPGLSDGEIPVIDLGSNLPGWRITLAYQGENLTEEAIRERLKFYRVTGGAVILTVLLLTVVVVRLFREQLRLIRIRNDLVSSVSHELKTPLASIRVLVDSLRAGKIRDETHYHRYLELISRENQRLTRLIENFLCFSRMERKQPQFDLEFTNLNTIISEVSEAMEDRFKSPDCSFNMDLQENLPQIRGDSDALKTVIVNLLDNAWKYTGTTKEIVVKTSQRSAQVVLAVADNGIGFDPRDSETLFQPFSQANNKPNYQGDGCGLGLSIVKFVLEAHRASITADSQPDSGSTFTICFPAASPHDGDIQLPVQVEQNSSLQEYIPSGSGTNHKR